MSIDEEKDLIVGILLSFLDQAGLPELVSYLQHVRLDVGALRRPKDLIPAWLGHYRIKQGVYDVDRACADLTSYLPIASRIAELKAAERGV